MSTQPATGAATAVHPVFEPVILGFTCNWCSYRAADLAGTSRIKYPPNVRLIRLMCSGRLDPTFVLKAFAEGADAVVMTGCWPADCHYRIQNAKALRRFMLLQRVVAGLGIEPVRLQRVYASAAEGQQLAEAFERIVGEVRALGPLDWRARATAASAAGALASDSDADGPLEAPDIGAAAPDPAASGPTPGAEAHAEVPA